MCLSRKPGGDITGARHVNHLIYLMVPPPLSSARLHPAMHFRGDRLRRRGPRSKLALLRRSVPKHRRALPGMAPGESGDAMPVNVTNMSQWSDNHTHNSSRCMPQVSERMRLVAASLFIM